ncbi:hypothetical protein G5B35_17145 [Parapusillimonas sp. SGNA-6]|nr:hypothetical protein [Parapusillimonas sp. SGNA-6]
MSKAKKIPGTIEAWESGALGESAEHAALAPEEVQKAIDDAVAMQLISIRLPKSVIEDFKAIAAFEGIGYQPLMREALIRFANVEAKRIMHEVVATQKRERAAAAAKNKAA